MQKGKNVLLLTMAFLLAAVMPARAGYRALQDIYGSSATNIYMVGDTGTVMHYDGTTWQRMATPEIAHGLNHVWASSASDVYVSGGPIAKGRLWHYDGTDWSAVEPALPDFNPQFDRVKNVWGVSANSVFALAETGNGTEVFHFDGTSWASIGVIELYIRDNGGTIIGTATNNVYVAGKEALYRWDGMGWSQKLDVGPTDVWCAPSGTVFACMAGGSIERSDDNGDTWTLMDSGTDSDIATIWGLALGDVYALSSSGMLHYDGNAANSWTLLSSPAMTSLSPLYSITGGAQMWGSAADDIYFLAGSILMHYDGNQARPVNPGDYFPGDWFSAFSDEVSRSRSYAINGWSTDDLYAIGLETVDHYNGSSWNTAEELSVYGGPMLSSIFSILGAGFDSLMASENDLFVAAGMFIFHYNGTDMTIMNTLGGASGIWGSGPDDVFAVGVSMEAVMGGATANPGIFQHYDGNGWTVLQEIAGTPNDVWGASSSSLYIAGDAGSIWHYDGTTLSLMSSGTTNNLETIWGTSDSDIYAAGDSVVLHYNGSTWSPVPSAPSENFIKISGAGSGVYLQANDGTIYQYNSSTGWTDISIDPGTLPDGPHVADIWCSGTDSLFAIDKYHDAVYHWNGSEWSVVRGQWNFPLTDMWGSATDDMWSVGENGTVAHYNGVSWNVQDSSVTGTTQNLRKIWGNPPTPNDDVYAICDDGSVIHYDGSNWEPAAGLAGYGVSNIHSSAGDCMFAIAGGQVLYSDTASYPRTWAPRDVSLTDNLVGIWAASANSAFAITQSQVFQFDGTTWSEMTAGDVPGSEGYNNKIWGLSENSVFVLNGEDLYHYDGTEWRVMASCVRDLRDIWGRSDNDLYVTTEGSLIALPYALHYDGTGWEALVLGGGGICDLPASADTTYGFDAGDGNIIVSYEGTSRFPTTAPLQIGPSGSITTDMPEYQWNALDQATMYTLWINDETGLRLVKTYEAADICSGGTCSVQPVLPVSGQGEWWVSGTSISGIGPWSPGMTFEATEACCTEENDGALDIVGQEACSSTTDMIRVPVRIQNAYKPDPANVVCALGFDVLYDETALDFIAFEPADLLTGFETVKYNKVADGRARVGAFTLQEPGGAQIRKNQEGLLGYLVFEGEVAACVNLEAEALVDDIATWSVSGGCLRPSNGDLNLDGEVTPMDALCAFEKSMLVCDTHCGACETTTCDVTQDCVCDELDVMCLLNKYLGVTPNCLDWY